ncbi:M23 family metallopeptidase [Williamsia soli]|uniref:M23 family metallopeptidase n=1 Tax=Williamsia soli TaxID=364929 RepID=UPI001A9FE584|nr:M23 family metallopeptidase [Williamsia soli]
MRLSVKLVGIACVATLALVSCSESESDSTSASSSTASAPTTESTPAKITAVVVSTLADPIPVLGTDDRVHMAYELTVTNTLSQPTTITGVTASAGDEVLVELQGDEVGQWMRPFGATELTTTLTPGQASRIWIDASVPAEAETPTQIENEISVEVAQEDLPLVTKTMTVSSLTQVQDKTPVTIAPPLDGAGWLDGNGCCGMTAHRTAVSPLNGEYHAPERFAIDFVKLDAEGRLFTGDITQTSSYAYFGTDIHAVADGKVVAVVDGLQEQIPSITPSKLPVDQYAGNHIVQDIGNGHYVLYAHMQPGSMSAIKVGQELESGDKIGLLGNTGNTDAPHLHLHVMDGPDPLASNGLPFVIDTFTLDNVIAGDDAIEALITTGNPPAYGAPVSNPERKGEMPLTYDVMTFSVGK